MVGLYAEFGGARRGLDSGAVDAHLRFTGRERRHDYRDGGATVHAAFHPLFDGVQPVELPDGRLLWVWGDLRGYEDATGYHSRRDRPASESPAEFCRALYERSGMWFVAELNGEFAGFVYDPGGDEVRVFTDRLGARPMFVARGTDGELLCSTAIQLLAASPSFDPAFDGAAVAAYLTDNFVPGLETPLRGVRMLPPASVVTFDLDADTRRDERYWYPRYEPTDLSYGAFVDRFAETFEAALADCLVDGADHGLMLSAGSDSRLLAAALDRPATAFHLTDWEGRETRTARQVADAAGLPFRPLVRGPDYMDRLLAVAPRINGFNGWFQEGHALGFADELAEGADVVLFGLFADVFFKAEGIPRREVSVPLVGGRFELPVRRRIETLAAYRDLNACATPSYFRPFDSTAPILERAVRREGGDGSGGVSRFGVAYESVADLVRVSSFYPLTNRSGHFHYGGSIQLCPHRTPFLDRRLVDLHLSMPDSFRLRRDVVNAATARLAPDLAAIPHGSTWLPLTAPAPCHWAADKLRQARDKYLPTRAPEPYMSNGPWPDHDAHLRHTGFDESSFAAVADRLERLPFVDLDELEATYRAEAEGANVWPEIFAALTLARMPVTERILAGDEPGGEAPGAGDRTAEGTAEGGTGSAAGSAAVAGGQPESNP